MSASVFAAPRLKRIDPSVRAWGRPIAFRTCDGSSVPDEHADPDDTAMPARSSPISSDSASTRSMLMLVVFGTRGDAAPLRSVPETLDSTPASSRSRSALNRGASAAIFVLATSAATPRPTSAGTFSVPARRLRSCLPPVTGDTRRTPRFIHNAPVPFGP